MLGQFTSHPLLRQAGQRQADSTYIPPVAESSQVSMWNIWHKHFKEDILSQEELTVLGDKGRRRKAWRVKWPSKDTQQARAKPGEAAPPLSHIGVIFAAYHDQNPIKEGIRLSTCSSKNSNSSWQTKISIQISPPKPPVKVTQSRALFSCPAKQRIAQHEPKPQTWKMNGNFAYSQ